MNRFPVPLRFVATVLLSGILVSLGIVNLRDRAAWTDPTDGVYLGRIERDAEGGRGLILEDRAALQEYARASSSYRLTETSFRLGEYSDLIYRANPGAALDYALTNGTSNRNVTVRLGSKSLLGARDRLRALLAFLHLGVGIFVLVRGRQMPRSFHFYLICLTAFVVYLFSYTPRLGALDWWVYGLSVLRVYYFSGSFCSFQPAVSNGYRGRNGRGHSVVVCAGDAFWD